MAVTEHIAGNMTCKCGQTPPFNFIAEKRVTVRQDPKTQKMVVVETGNFFKCIKCGKAVQELR